FFCSLRNLGTHDFGSRNVAASSLTQLRLFIQGRCRGQCDASLVIYHLSKDVIERSEHSETGSVTGSGDSLPNSQMNSLSYVVSVSLFGHVLQDLRSGFVAAE